MKVMGSDIECTAHTQYSYITDTGRSSLRLILRSGLNRKKFLLPDYLCPIIPDILEQEGGSYSYYKINDDLTINWESVHSQYFDVLYVISYFGQKHSLTSQNIQDEVIVVEDNVFLPAMDKPPYLIKWIGFNSLRKVSCLADGSLIHSTIELDVSAIQKGTSEYPQLKYAAKQKKFDYIHLGKHSEQEFLAASEEAEECLRNQSEISGISEQSLLRLLDFYRNLQAEYRTRRANFETLSKHLAKVAIPIEAEYPSLFPMSLERRDELRNYLFKKNIFLPVHWPPAAGTQNRLADTILSIPVDSRYGQETMLFVAKAINDFCLV